MTKSAFVLLIPAFAFVTAALPLRAAEHGFAATVNPLATQAALGAMKAGGNAVDGAIAAAVMLGVVDQHNSGIGGGLFMLIRSPDGTFAAIDGREMAPAAATRGMFIRDGQPDPKLAQEGALAAGVPGWLAALDQAASAFGKLPLARPLREAAQVAEDGFKPDPGFAERRKNMAQALGRHPETAAVLLAPLNDGKLKMTDLAASYRHIADGGISWFYGGPFAEKTETWMKANGGLMTAADLKNYQVKRREPLRSTYRGYDIVGFPPPSSGGVHVAEILNILENFDLKSMGDGSPDFIHVVTEAMKPAFADRAFWLGDPDFSKVPRGLIDSAYAKTLAQKIDRAKVTPVPAHGDPPAAGTDVFSKHTTHFSVTDSDGWSVACTATINNTWGSLVTIPGTGILLNNEMDDFSVQPGVPNSFGLVGGEANAVAPGKRPLSSMSPTIVQKDGQLVLVIGAAGGPTIITQVLLGVVRTIDFGRTPQEALAGPRFHHQWQPDALRIERDVPAATRAELEKRGHILNVVPAMGVSQAIARAADGTFTGAADPRAHGSAAGF
ncbi:MAG: gamma-glutamyltransferase [Verrucomicrobiota bacterium]